jgi:phenylpropionate dioxygenase-like ring-hydroxylating dioxygenase large terminal subunit
VCGYHGWTYDRAGRVLRIPQIERHAPESARVRSFPAEERYGYVWVCLDNAPLLEIPEIPEWNDPAFRRIPEFYEVWRCAGLRLMENSFDNAHVNFVHRGTFGDPQDAGESRFEFVEEPWGFRTRTRFPVKQTELAARANRIEGAKTERIIEGSWWIPFVRRAHMAYPSGLVHVIVTAATPMCRLRRPRASATWPPTKWASSCASAFSRCFASTAKRRFAARQARCISAIGRGSGHSSPLSRVPGFDRFC